MRSNTHATTCDVPGGVVERAEKSCLFGDPAHPYTKALLSAIPHSDPDAVAVREEIVLEGEIPSPANPPSGCRFHTRCPSRISGLCDLVVPAIRRTGERQEVACHLCQQDLGARLAR